MRSAVLLAAIAGGLYGRCLLSQEVSGSLTGRVVTTSLQPAPDAKVMVSGRDLLRSRSAAPDRGGYFQVHSLPPGTYTVRFTRLGSQPVSLDRVVVELGHATQLPTVALQESPIQLEDVHVEASEQSIDATRTEVGATLSAADYAALPGDRDYKSIVSILPHANESTRGDPINVAGATGLENMYYVDGVNVTTPIQAETGTSLPYNFVKAIEVKTGGYQAQYGSALGALVNAVTYSGTNVFETNFFAFGTHSSLSSRPKAEPTLREAGAMSYDVGVRISGPVLRDRLWYSVAYNPRVDRVDREIQGHGKFTDEANAQIFAGKLTWQSNPTTEIQLSVFGDPTTHHAVAVPSGVPSGLTPLTPDSYLTRLKRGSWVRAVRARKMFGDRSIIEASLSRSDGRQKMEGETEFARISPLFIDLLSREVSGGIQFFENSRLNRSAAMLRGTLTKGAHTVVVGGEFEDVATARTIFTSGGFQIERDAQGNYSTFAEGGAGEFHNRVPVSYVQDSWRIADGISVNAGLRWSSQSLSGASGKVAQRFRNEWQPRVGVIWQPGKSENQAFFASAGRFYQQLPLNLSSIFYVDYSASFFSYSSDPRQPGAIADDSSNFATRESDSHNMKGLSAEHFDEATLGYERLIGKASKVTARVIRRELRSSFQWGFFSADSVVLGTPGKGDFAFLPKPIRRYTALELAGVGKVGEFRYRTSYVLSRNWGNYTGFYEPDFGYANPGGNAGFIAPHQALNSKGPLPNDRTHVLKLSGAASSQRRFSAGFSFLWESGSPLNEFAPGPDPSLAIQRAFVVRRGSAGRTPALWDLSVRLGYAIKRYQSADTRVVLDVLHLGNPQEVVWTEELKYLVNTNGVFGSANPTYGQPIAYQRPMLARVGWELNF